MKTREVDNVVALEARNVELKRILFATDFSSYSNAALPYAVALARQYGAKLYGAHVVSTDAYMFATPETWPALAECQGERQHAACVRLEESLRGTPHQVVSAVGDIADVIFRLVHNNDIDLIVLGTHGRSGLPKLFMGSVAEKIFRQASCPVLTVGPNVCPKEHSALDVHRIVFATDFSDESIAAAPYAFSLAQKHNSHLTLLHVLEHPQGATVDFEPNVDFAIRRMQELILRDSDVWFRSDCAVEFGRPEDEIAIFAQEHASDLIVLGIQALRGPFTTMTHLAHSKAQYIVAHATCPVFTVRG